MPDAEKRETFRSIVLYLIFGVITTLVNYAVYFPLYNKFHISSALSNIAAWTISVMVAFITNKQFVFISTKWEMSTVIPECIRFVCSRLLSGVLETLSLFICVDLLFINGNFVKLIASVLVVILNFVFSKWFVFLVKTSG